MALITDRTMATKPAGRDIWITEDAPKGHGRFCLRLTKAGEKIFYFRYTGPGGKREYYPIGGYDPAGKDGLKLSDARAKAGELSRFSQSGIIDIKGHLEAEDRLRKAQQAAEEARLEAERKAAEIEAARMSVKGLFEKWETLHLAGHKDKGKEIRRLFEKDVLPIVGALPAHLVRKGHVMEIVDAVVGRGAKRTAKLVFASLRQMFRFALERDFVEVDPTITIRRATIGGKEVERDRTLTDDEIKLLAKKMPASGLLPTAKAAVWISLSTGCRIGELLKARWSHVDLVKRTWLIPAENSKNTIPLEIYLSDFALAQFKTLEQHKHSDWLYPARWKDKETGKPRDTHVSVKTITKQIGDRQRATAMKRKSKATGTLALPSGGWTMHDLRRTASTIMGDLGIKPEVIDRCQNQKEPNRVRRTYQRYSYQPEMKEAWQLLGERLAALASGQEAAKVIPLKQPA
jgi:integrase